MNHLHCGMKNIILRKDVTDWLNRTETPPTNGRKPGMTAGVCRRNGGGIISIRPVSPRIPCIPKGRVCHSCDEEHRRDGSL